MNLLFVDKRVKHGVVFLTTNSLTEMHSILKTMELYSKMFSFQLQHFLWNDTDFLWCIQHDFGKDFMRFFGKKLIKTPSYWIDKIVPLEKTYLKGTTTKGCWTFSTGIQFVWNTSSLFCRNIGVLKKNTTLFYGVVFASVNVIVILVDV